MIGLALAARNSWRMVRAKLASAGVADPLRDIPTLHQLLDVVEAMAVEAKSIDGQDAVERFYFELYKPEPTEVRKQIETADTDTDFDAFAALGMH